MKSIILAGGSGARFWPSSRKNLPKQCLAITREKSMIEVTVDNLSKLVGRKNIYIATGSHLESLIRKLLPDINYIVEPMPKNTAACIGLAAISVPEDEVMIVETSDHHYLDVDSYLKNLKAGAKVAETGKIVLIGIKPSFPHTGYGYIKQGKLLTSFGNINIFNIDQFKEKPNLETAKKFLHEGNYLWNAGIFISKAKVLLEEIRLHMPKLYNALRKIKSSELNNDILKKEFEKLDSISIDYGIMERSKNTAIVRGEFHWDDVGDWKAMERIHKKDKKGNVVLGAYTGDAKDCIIIGKNIELHSVSDLIVVKNEDCLLVSNKERCQDVKKIIDILSADDILKRYTIEMLDRPIAKHISIDDKNVNVKSDILVATLSLSDVNIEVKDNKVKIYDNK